MVYSSFNNNSYPLDSITETYEDKNISDIIYETETNWNTLMKAVGILELVSVEKHGEIIYEAVDIKAFFKKIKEFFKGLLEKISRLFKKIIEKVKNLFSKNKHKNIPRNNQSTNSVEKKSSNDTESSTDKEEKRKEEPVNYDHKPIEYEGYEFKTDFLKCEIGSEGMVASAFDILSFHDEFIANLHNIEKDVEKAQEYFSKNFNDLMSNNMHEIYLIHKYLVPDLQITEGADFNSSLFKYFRNNRTEKQKIIMKETDIDIYGKFIDDIPNNIDNVLNKSYTSLKKYIDTFISICENQYRSDDPKKDPLFIKVCNIYTHWYKIILEQYSILITTHSNAIIAQGNQYKAALKKILSGQPYDAKRYHSSAVFDAFMSNGDGTFVLS